VLHTRSPRESAGFQAFAQSLRELNYVEGKTVTFEREARNDTRATLSRTVTGMW
jgi:hypothetical protein